MINISKILKRAWNILWNYRVLWIFGILLAITAGGGGSSSGSNSGYRSSGDSANNYFQGLPPSKYPQVREFQQWLQQDVVPMFTHPEQNIATFIWIGVGLFLFILIIAALFALVRYPTETAILRMVDEYEKSGTKMGFRQGWKMGWNRRAFRMWVIDLVLGLPVIFLVAVVGGLATAIYFSTKNGSQMAIATSVITGIGCAFLFIFAFVVLMVLLGLLRQFFIRAAALEDKRIGESFRSGWEMCKRNWKSAGLMWLVMLGIGIAFGILMLVVFFLLIPVYLVLILPAALVAAIPGLAVFGITSIFAGGPLTWILGLIAATPFFFTVVFAPLLFVTGWYKVYEANVWTLTYREISALESVAPVVVKTLEQ